MSSKNRSGEAEPDEKQNRSYEKLQNRLSELYDRFRDESSKAPDETDSGSGR